MTKVVRITGGKNGLIHPPFIIFQNKSRNYHIRGLPDDGPGVSHRPGTKGLLDQRELDEGPLEIRAISKDDFRRQPTIFLDNCSDHLESDIQRENLTKLIAVIKFLLKNATHLRQPAESFVIQDFE